MIIGSVSSSKPQNAHTAAARRRRAARVALVPEQMPEQAPEDTAKPGLLDRSRQLVGRVLNTITGRGNA
jgi:hypothetical protein